MKLIGFPHSSVGKESACDAGDAGSIPGSGRSPDEGNGNPFQYSCLENPMDRGAWRATLHGEARVGHDLVIKSPPSAPWGFPSGSAVKNLPLTQERRVRCLDQENPLEEVMATHSSILAWEIPQTEESGGL